jgi:hypothetical protein
LGWCIVALENGWQGFEGDNKAGLIDLLLTETIRAMHGER